MPRPISALAVLVLAFGAMADEPDLAPVSSLTVDLERVVELGTVSPVDGITSAGQPDKAALALVSGTCLAREESGHFGLEIGQLALVPRSPK